MITLFTWPTANGKKISIMLEECELGYEAVPVNIQKGEQFKPEFLAISPNNKIPAIVDHDAEGGSLAIFESGAILQYLAEKAGKLLPTDPPSKFRVLQWLHWQIGGLGPNAGQAHHFLRFCKEPVPYAQTRFKNEVARLYGVMDRQLAQNEFLAGDYSIADIACWGWVTRWEWQGVQLSDYPNVQRWFETIAQRPAVIRGNAVGADWIAQAPPMTREDEARLFGNQPR
ncbi:MAG: glutathione S-transferase N-terminal domain-containing protein [Spongiibacteraceae bacterium]|jgi:GST-like protein|nr:glutathione S-transferase N-terminal domain-containing protein [Spongiibacteraceae bacterium]